ncbi:MAG: TrkH family potassium uptake protein [Acidimicrobiia bacterium]
MVPRRPPRMGRRLSYIIGAVVVAAGAAMLPAVVTSLLYREWEAAVGIGLAAFVTVVGGLAGWRVIGRPGQITTKEGFAAVGLAWFIMSAFGTLPYLVTGSIPSLTDAFFETASGFTTTGASIVPDPSILPKGILMWRALTQWVGGMGVIVLSVAVLPLLGVGGVQLARAESPGHTPDRLTPRFQETAKRLWLVYVGATVLQVALLAAGEMDLFEAIVHSFATLATGGFGTEPDSIASFSPYSQWVIVVFMLVASTSFALHYRGLRRPSEYLRNPELRLFLAIVAVAVVLVAGGLFRHHPGESVVRDAVFTAVSIISTTGFATADFSSWVPALQIVLVGLMFLGGMSGSTAGALKTFRLAILAKAAGADLRRLVYPRGVFITRFGDRRIPDPVVESVQSFFLFYMLIFMASTFLVGFIDVNTRADFDLVTSASAVASAMGNVGPGLGEVGPTGSYLGVPLPGKWLLSGLMIVGRLEIFPVLLLFTRDLWRR